MMPQVILKAMRALFHILLLVGVLFGLATQGVALAAEPCPMEQAQSSAMAGMEDCCPQDGPSSHDGAPCSDMTLACLAMAGCATLGALDLDGTSELAVQKLGAPQFWMMATALYGRTIPPDTHPPARLG